MQAGCIICLRRPLEGMDPNRKPIEFPAQLTKLEDLPECSAFFTGAGKPELIRGHHRAQRAWLYGPESLQEMLRAFSLGQPLTAQKRTEVAVQPRLECDLCIRFDGCTEGNPGPMGVGVACFLQDDLTNPVQVYRMPVTVGGKDVIGTNNLTEIVACISALWICSQIIDSHPGLQILVQGDSQNCVRWITGEYRINEEKLAPFVGFAQSMLESLRPCGVRLDHIRREFNFVADDLSKEALGIPPEEFGRWSLRTVSQSLVH